MLAVSQIQDWIADQLHETRTDLTTTNTALTSNLMLRWVNEGLAEVARAAPWQWLEAQEVFTLGADGTGANTGNGVTYFPHRVWRLHSLWAGNRGYREPILIIGAWELDAMSPSTVVGTVSDYLAVWGYYNVARDNPTTGVLAVADTGTSTVQVRIEGVDNNGNEVAEDVATGNSTNQFAAGPDGVRRIYALNSTVVAGTGIVTVTSGGTQIERLNVAGGERIRERLRTELSPAPTAPNNTYVVRYYKRIREVASDDDMVDIPFEFENLLFHAIGRRLALYRGDTDQVGYFEQSFGQTVRQLKAWQNRQPGRMRGLRGLSSYGFRSFQGWG
jgi:hypothetical protein